MSVTYRGSNEPQLQRISERYSPSTGYTRELEYRGMSEARARQYAQYFGRSGMEYEFAVSHGICTLVATDTSGSVTIDTWEVGINQEIASSFKNPRNLNAIGQDTIDIMACAFRDGLSFEDATDKVNANRTALHQSAAVFAWSAAASGLYQRLLAGDEGFYHDKYVLRHTTNVSNRWQVNVADENKGFIYTHAQALSEVQNANSWIYPLPGRLVYKLNNAAVFNAPAPQDNFLWGWLKGASPESTAANNRVNIVTEYKLFQWSTDEYATV